MLAEILNVVQVFTPAHAVTVCYCCYCCSAASKQKTAKNPGKTREYPGFSRYFRVLPALDAGDRRGSLPGLPYCCSAGLTLATVVGEPHCCSVVTVNTSNTVQLLTFDNPRSIDMSIEHPARSTPHVHTRQPTAVTAEPAHPPMGHGHAVTCVRILSTHLHNASF